MARSGNKSDMASGSGPTFSGKTKGARGIGNIRSGVGGVPSVGTKKAPSNVGWPGAADSSLYPGDHIQSAK